MSRTRSGPAATLDEPAPAKHWGQELLLDLKGCNVEAVTSEEYLRAFMAALVEEIGMTAFGEPWLRRFATHDPRVAGITLFQPISTSSITGHFVDATGDGYLNVFSCKPFKAGLVVALAQRFLQPRRVTERLLDRG